MKISKIVIPNAVTSIAVLTGYLAIMFSLDGDYVAAAWLIVLIALLDSLDGRLARALNVTSDFGAQLDSLADVLNFGVALSLMYYFAFFSTSGVAGMMLSFAPTLFSAYRLARFNVEQEDCTCKPAYFTGLPTTVSALLLASFIIFASVVGFETIPVFVPVMLVILTSLLMVSEVPYETNGTLLAGITAENRKKLLAVLFLTSLLLVPARAFFVWTTMFVLFGLLRSMVVTVSELRHREAN